MSPSQVAERLETLTGAFDAFRTERTFGPDSLARARETSFRRFQDRGFPTTRDEEWRFTNVAPIAELKFVRPAEAPSPADQVIAPYFFEQIPTVVVVNGRVSKALSALAGLPAGVAIEEGASMAGGRERAVAGNAFVDLNGAFFEDVVTIRIAPGTVASAPLHVLSVVVPGPTASLVAPRLVIEAGEASQVKVIESYATIGAGTALVTAVTDITLDAGAVVDHVKIQRESAAVFHLASTFVSLGRASTFTSQAITFGGRIARNDISAVLDGEGAECTLNGLYLADGDAVVDTHTTIDHAKPHCPSHEVYKGILGGRSKAVFNGKIIVRPDAQKTDAKQTNKALLLTDDAQINTKPQLEIFADDVKCTHGAAIGQLDDDAMFYLRARGIAESDARSLLIHAFAGQVLDGIKVDAVRERVQQVMEEKLRDRALMKTTAPFASLDVQKIRADFPALHQAAHGRPLVYLDNAATTQKPRAVLDAIRRYYEEDNANVHRGVHLLSQRATDAYEDAREEVRAFINAASTREIVYTRNATESINLVARAWGDANVRTGDEVVISAMEHHSNIVPWQQLCARTGGVLRVAPMNDRGELLMDELERLLSARTKIVSVVHLSNALGTINPVEEIVRLAHQAGALALVDGSQAAYHMPVDVTAMDADFYVFTGHKVYGPTGIGILYGRESVLQATPPFMGGGDMISSVTFECSTWNELPYKFEAGTPHIAGAIGLGAAIDYVRDIGFDAIAPHEAALLEYGTERLQTVRGLRLIGTARRKASVLSFVMDGIHPHDIGTIVDREGVAIRTGHHCAQPVMDRLGIAATARASLAMYNTKEDIDALVTALGRVRALLGE